MTEAVKVRILEQDYTIACPEDAKNSLLQSADYVDRKMREVRQSGKVVGTDRVAVMAAINIAYELLEAHAENQEMADVRKRLARLDERIAETVANDAKANTGKSG
ncbi:cell division protein ZapA [Halorhodospira halochloris]|uniref:Cell division protein ZapA n=1 Tax=Halorhodospira halochloris TaxID=1052 RepID=A0A120MZK9_HALHR|nr:cell division protein ZapA [Halorhodospira halochloris]MBK1650791.1 cell division protein ZapA [Halorhodospira halochloris]MCG5530230.1 cell division protein ZapA [Halorhodospira halochloris]MCG5547144.1 cell division protein ZapA [Halorhodospira halochloris]BAU56711.1 Z-ring-associated protein ZapA [Halorhodospira halochloris]